MLTEITLKWDPASLVAFINNLKPFKRCIMPIAIRQLTHYSITALMLVFLVACGGGGGSETPDPIVSVDTIAPVITINGESTVSINQGETYTELGATATDNKDGSVTVTISGTVDTNVATVYTITYSATDAAGNSGSKTRMVTVVLDTTPNNFNFVDQSVEYTTFMVESNIITISGIHSSAPISIAGGEYSIDGGDYTNSDGQIDNGQSLRLRQRSANKYFTRTETVVTVGGISSVFEVFTDTPNSSELFSSDQIVSNGNNIYLLNSLDKEILRWSINDFQYIDSFYIGNLETTLDATPSQMTYSSSHNRLYLGYSNGQITYIDVNGNGTEISFANIPLAVDGLASVGNYTLAQDSSGSWNTHYVFEVNGTLTDSKDWNYYSREYSWNPNNSRVFFFGNNDLNYEEIDQTTGLISGKGDSPHHDYYKPILPISISADGSKVLLGTGDLYDSTSLAWQGSIGAQLAAAQWLSDNSLVTLSNINGQVILQRRDSSLLNIVEQLSYPGEAMAIFGTETGMVLVLNENNTTTFINYIPNDDNDGDGILNTDDAFPLDAAASLDSDGDGFPDAWHLGHDETTSTTSLTLDAYPNDSACQLSSHGDGINCDYERAVPAFVPDQIISNGSDVFLLSQENLRVYRWSIANSAYTNPLFVGIKLGTNDITPTRMAYSAAHNRLYLGYSTGQISYIDLAGSSEEVAFTNLSLTMRGLASVGNFLLAAESSVMSSDRQHHVLDINGIIKHSESARPDFQAYAWNPSNSKVYHMGDGTAWGFEIIDQVSGQILDPRDGGRNDNIIAPVSISADGSKVLMGSGNFYDTTKSHSPWQGSIGSTQFAAAQWLSDNSLVTLSNINGQVILQRRDSSLLKIVEQLSYPGEAMAIFGTETGMVLVLNENNTTTFINYIPNDDNDGDGILNTDDAFPLDAAASLDSDGDGFPDAWHLGHDETTSTTSLTLDAYPNDSACQLSSHGDGINCDYEGAVPAYVPDQIISNGSDVFLLSQENLRVYRWSIANSAYTNPLFVGIKLGLSHIAPIKIAYSAAHNRLYLGYPTGQIRYIDLTGSSEEVAFSSLYKAVNGLVSAGNYLLAQDNREGISRATHSIFDINGNLTDSENGSAHSKVFAWNPSNSRTYYFRDHSMPGDIHYEEIDQTAGLISSWGESPYHGDYIHIPPISISADGSQVLLGNGDLYDSTNLFWQGSIDIQLAAAQWLSDNSLVILSNINDQVILQHRDSSLFNIVEELSYSGEAMAIFGTETGMVLIINESNNINFVNYVPN